MRAIEKISCTNNAGFVMNFSVRWLGSDGKWNSTEWNSGNYPINQTRISPNLASIGVPSDAVAITPHVHAILGTSRDGEQLVDFKDNDQVAAYEVKGTTLSFGVDLID